jgi:lysophospholipase L1-like esterase
MSDDSSSLNPIYRIVVLGNSQALVVASVDWSRTEGNYGELLERGLRRRGVNAMVINEARLWDLLHYVRPRLVESIGCHSPDVVVLGYGMGECESNIPPTWLMKIIDFGRWIPSLNPVSRRVRKVSWPLLHRFRTWSQRRLIPLFGKRLWRERPARFTAELDRIIRFTRAQTGARVIVLSLYDPGPALEEIIPTIRKRAERFNQIIHDVVARFDPSDVRVVDIWTPINELGWEKATYEGLHYSATGHAMIADALKDAIVGFIASDEAEAPEPGVLRQERAAELDATG